jgi:hypothetical protein
MFQDEIKTKSRTLMLILVQPRAKPPALLTYQLWTIILQETWVCIQKFPDWVHNEINNKHTAGSNTKGYGGKTHHTASQNSDTTASSGRELYHLQFSRQAASPETFGYTLVKVRLLLCKLMNVNFDDFKFM